MTKDYAEKRAALAAKCRRALPELSEAEKKLDTRIAALREELRAELGGQIPGSLPVLWDEKLRESGMRKPIIGSEVRTYYRYDLLYKRDLQTLCQLQAAASGNLYGTLGIPNGIHQFSQQLFQYLTYLSMMSAVLRIDHFSFRINGHYFYGC